MIRNSVKSLFHLQYILFYICKQRINDIKFKRYIIILLEQLLQICLSCLKV